MSRSDQGLWADVAIARQRFRNWANPKTRQQTKREMARDAKDELWGRLIALLVMLGFIALIMLR